MAYARRKDRELDQQEASEILKLAEYGILSTVGKDKLPYGVPVSFCFEQGYVYFHCALDGRKLDNLEHNPAVSFCAVGKTQVLPEEFSTKYESAIVSGHATEVFDEEKQFGLECLVKKYCADYFEEGLKNIEDYQEMTRVYKISIEQLSGKARRK